MKWLASIGLSGTVLALFAAVTSIAIGWTYLSTEEQIEVAIRRAEAQQLLEIFPAGTHDNELVDDTFSIASNTALLGLREERQGYRVRLSGQHCRSDSSQRLRGMATVAILEPLVGIRQDGSVAGVRVVAHRETPGLGDKVELRKSAWVLGFNDRSLSNPGLNRWSVKKEGGVFDQFTGATVTPMAVILATRRALEYATLNAEALFESAGDPS